MTKMTSFVIIALALSVAQQSVAQTADCSADKKRTSVFFVNGMFTTEANATRNRAALRTLAESDLQNAVGEDGILTFDTAYNQNEPAWEQLVQVYAQKAGDDLSAFWRMINGNTLLPDWLKQAISDATGANMASALQPFTNDADLAQHMQSYRAALDLHAKLVIVSHSQGNFYANAAYSELASEKPEYGAATGVIGVASPASTVAGAVDGGPYTTFSEDWVINAVRFIYPNTLPANATTGTTTVDGLSHGFQTAYLAVPDARAAILSNVVQVESGLVPVPKPATGTDPTCLPLVVQDPADCAAALANSCVDKFFGSCWDPSGSCSMLTSTASTSANLIPLSGPVWSNGASINMAADMTNPDAPSVEISVVGSTGNVCATGVSQYMGGGACLAEAIYQARGESLSICAHEDGTAELTCPDGTVIELPTENCAFSKTNAADCVLSSE